MRESRDELLTRLDSLLKRNALFRSVKLGSEYGPPKGAIWYERPRLMIPLEGAYHAGCDTGSHENEVWLKPGHNLYVLPNGWTLEPRDSRHSLFGIVFRKEYTRFLWYTHGGNRRPPRAPDVWHHTTTQLTTTGEQLLQAMNGLAGPDHSEVTRTNTFRALVSAARDHLASDRGDARGKAHHNWRVLCNYVEEHCHEQIDRTTIAASLRIHPNSVSRLFRSQGNESLQDYLTRTRMRKASALLERSDLTVDEVAGSCGYRHTSYFIKAFRRFAGVTPGQHRQRGRR